MFNRVKWFIQRRKRGFDDRELWSLDNSLCEWLAPRVKALRLSEKGGYPFAIMSKKHQKSPDLITSKVDDIYMKKWADIIYSIERFCYLHNNSHLLMDTFDEHGNNINDFDFEALANNKYTIAENEKLMREYDKGKRNFTKHFTNLWY